MWSCYKCHEQNEENFEVCWSCGTSKDGIENKSFQPVDEIAPSNIKGLPVLLTSTGIINAEDSSTYPNQQTVEQMVCLKCGSSDIIPNVRILTHLHEQNLLVEIYDNPKALIFKGSHTAMLRAFLCGQCGYTEMYVGNPQYLLNSYRKNQKI